MKHFPILDGRAYVVEMPEGAETIHLAFNDGFWHLIYFTYHGEILTRNRMPSGTWQIVGMLPEVTEEDAKAIVDYFTTDEEFRSEDVFRDYSDKSFYDTALESLESAILAEGHTFKNKYGDVRPRIDDYSSVFQYRNDAIDYDDEKERVLCRKRCLLLRRVEG